MIGGTLRWSWSPPCCLAAARQLLAVVDPDGLDIDRVLADVLAVLDRAFEGDEADLVGPPIVVDRSAPRLLEAAAQQASTSGPR